jgi:hypothetical protein
VRHVLQDTQLIMLSQTLQFLQLKFLDKGEADVDTTFWNVHRTIAEEYDTDFRAKYSGNLDISLNFVCVLHIIVNLADLF